MEEVPVTRTYLESLTTAELARMADTWGIDVPPDLDRIFIIEELLDAASQDGLDSVPEEFAFFPVPVNPEFEVKESVPLPKQYNITFIEVMIRDPLWAFVFWEIKASDKEQFEKAQDFVGYYLKVSPLDKPDDSFPEEEGDGVFTVPVKPEDSAWYLGLNPAARNGDFPKDQKRYKVELCAGMRNAETVIAVSKPFTLPELSAGRIPAEKSAYPLVCLSGYGDFHVTQSNERTQRIKKGAEAASYE